MEYKKGYIGLEDLRIGNSTFLRKNSQGVYVEKTEVNRTHFGINWYADVRDYPSLNSAITALNALSINSCLMIPTQQTVNIDITCNSNVFLHPIGDGGFSIDSGYTLTINSPSHILSPKSQKIFSGAGTVAFTSKFGIVYPDMWTKNTTPGTTDMTDAIDYALATECNVGLFAAIYGTTGDHYIEDHYQHLIGKGRGLTTLKKLSGTNVILQTNHGLSYVQLRGVTFDGNSLGGECLIWRSHYSMPTNLAFTNQGGTSYAMRVSGTNVSEINDIIFHGANYAGLIIDESGDSYTPTPTYGALYTKLSSLYFGTFTGACAIEIKGNQSLALEFEHIYIEESTTGPSIYIHGTNTACYLFKNVNAEYGTLADHLIKINSTTAYDIHFEGGRLSSNAVNTNYSVFHITNARSVSVSKFLFNDAYSLAGRTIITLDTVKHFEAYNNQVSFLNNFVFINSSGCGSIVSRNNRTREDYAGLPGTGTCTFGSAGVIHENSDFQAALGSSTLVNLSNITSQHSQKSAGLITIADDNYYDLFGDGGSTSPGLDFVGFVFIFVSTAAVVDINNAAIFFAQTSAVSSSQLNAQVLAGSNVEWDNIADSATASLAATTDGKLGVQIGGGSAATRFIRIYNRTGDSITLRIFVIR